MNENIFSNPFIFAGVLIIVLTIMFIFFYRPTIGRKTFIRSLFYMYVVTCGALYFHHRQLQLEFDSKLQSNLNIGLVTKEGSSEEAIIPLIGASQSEKPKVNFEDELI